MSQNYNNPLNIPSPQRHVRPYNKDHKDSQSCDCCHETKPMTAFNYLSNYKLYRRQCTECYNKIQREKYPARRAIKKMEQDPEAEKARIIAYLDCLKRNQPSTFTSIIEAF